MSQVTNRYRQLLVGAAVISLAWVPHTHANAADEGAGLLAGAVVGAASVAAYMNSVEEQLEHFAVERVLESRKDLAQFEVSLISFNASSLLDLSTVRAVPCLVTPNGGEPFVLLLLFDSGWVSSGGVELTKVSHRFIDREAWNRIMGAVVVVAGGFETADLAKIPVYDRAAFRAVRMSGSAASRPATAHASYQQLRRISGQSAHFEIDDLCLKAPLVQLGDDEYRVQSVKGIGRVVYNERAVHLYLDEFARLVRFRRSTLERLHRGLFPSAGACESDDM